MGIDLHSLNFLRFVHKTHGNFGKTVTLARHGLHVTKTIADDDFNKAIVEKAKAKNEYFIDETLKRVFGSSSVDSIDFSDYQDATIIHDLNMPIDKNTPQFDTVIDAGTSEHIFSINTALANARNLCKPNGTLIHILPANNFCGHGFWQFSPELFIGLYCEANGFRDTEVYLAKLDDPKRWFRLVNFAHGGRANFFSSLRVHLMVKTVKLNGVKGQIFPPQQLDYTELWTRTKDSAEMRRNLRRDSFARLRSYVSASPTLSSWRNRLFYTRAPLSMRLNGLNPCIETVRVNQMISHQHQPQV
jgi:SAM-dependent methyltransferase